MGLNNINICFVTDNNYAKYIATAILSITENAADTDNLHFYIIHEDISEPNKEMMQVAVRNKGEITFVNIKDTDWYFKIMQIKQKVGYISKASYFKFVIPELLKDIDRVIFLDNDIIVKQSLADLFSTDLEGMLFGAVEDVGYTYWRDYSPKFKIKYMCINSGVMLIDCNKWLECNLSETLINAAREDVMGNFGQDQPIFNYVCKDKIKILDYRWNVQGSFLREEPERANHVNKELIIEAANNPAILHYAGCEKPWDNFEVIKGEEWHYYEELLREILPIKFKLQICIITYNRKFYLERTLEQLLAEDSPVRNYDITILDNASTDGTGELAEEYCKKYSNLNYIRHKVNIGGNGNVIKAFELSVESGKEYFWGLCDDDKFDFSNWAEVEEKMAQKKDIICLSNYGIRFDGKSEISLSDKLLQLTFFPAGIYRTDLIQSNVLINMTYSISDCFPHLCATIHTINKGGEIYVLSDPVVFNGLHCETSCKEVQLTRGAVDTERAVRLENSSWILGYANILNLLSNKSMKRELLTQAILHDEVYGNWDRFYEDMFYRYFEKKMYNYLYEIFSVLPAKRILQFMKKAIIRTIKFRNESCKTMQDWLGHFERMNFQNNIDKLAKKLDGKKILLYGNGMISKILQNNYDLSKLNIVAVTDRKYLGCDGDKCRYTTVSPNKINTIDYDVMLIALKQADQIKKSFIDKGLKKEIISFIE